MGDISKRLWRKAGLQRVPLTGAFELLPTCNLRCKMCYVRKSPDEVRKLGGLLATEEWLDYARQAKSLGMLFPLLTGGEPFLHPDFQKIFAEMRSMGLQISINSNGTLIDEPMAKWLGKNKPIRINMTLYGGNEESYQNLCGDGNAYRKMRRAVELLKHYDVPVKFNASITPENINDLEAMVDYAASVQSPIQVATYMFPPLRRDISSVGKNHRLSPEQAAYAKVKVDWLQRDSIWFEQQAKRFANFIPVTPEMLNDLSTKPGGGMLCRAGRCSFWIDWQGYLSNCGMYSSVRHMLRGQEFDIVWQKVVEETDNVKFSPICHNCPNMSLCHSCIAMVYNECGNENGYPEYLCRMHQASAEYYQEFAKKPRGFSSATSTWMPEECPIE